MFFEKLMKFDLRKRQDKNVVENKAGEKDVRSFLIGSHFQNT